MKKSLKRTCAVALAVAATAGISGVDKVIASNNVQDVNSKNIVFAQGTEITDGVLSISKYSKSVNLGEEFTMPTAKLNGVAFAGTVLVKTPSGRELTANDIGADNKFKVDEIGTYVITYADGNYVGEVSFVSSISSYSISLETNKENILPSKVGTNYKKDANAEDKYINLPSYVVKNKNGDIQTDADVDVKITVTTPAFDTISITDGKYSFTTLTKGTYIVTYSVYTKDGNFLTKLEQEFKCVEGDTFEADAKLVLSYSKEKPQSVNIGKTVVLPSLSAKVGTESVPVYYTVEVWKNGKDKLNADEVVGETTVLKRTEDGAYEFTAKEKANFYTVKYTAKSALGEKEAVTEFVIETVEDSLKPTPIVVAPYEVQEDGSFIVAGETVNKLSDISYKLASNVNNKNIEILPIYAEDLGTFSSEDFTFEREIRDSSSRVIYTDTENANKKIIFNFTGADSDIPADAIVAKGEDETAITLTDGTYRVYYTAKDKSGNEQTINYQFVVNALFDGREDGKEVAPVITFNDVFYESVDAGEDVVFGKVTFSDDNDDRLETSVYCEYQDAAGAVLKTVELELNDSNKYVVSTDTNSADVPTNSHKVVIYAKAINDSGFSTVETKTVVINSQGTGEGTPIVTSVSSYESTVVQGTDIVVPTIVFEDVNASGESDDLNGLNAEISIVCKTSEDKTINYDAYNAIAIRNQSAGTYTYSNATFTAATAGTYTVTVKATDAAGNVVIKFLTYTVTDATYTGKLRFTNIGLTDTTIELGETFKLPNATIVGENHDDYAYEVRLQKGPAGYKLNNDKFIPSAVGDYTLEYVMYEVATGTIVEGESVVVNITVEDSTKPEIYVNWKATVVDGETATGEILGAYQKGTKILLPMFSASDLSGIDKSKSMITITCSSSSGSEVIPFDQMATEYDKGTAGQRMYYTFSKDGEYTITYTAFDKEGNSDKKVFTIKIGDLDAPEFEVKDSWLKSEYKIGDEIKIDLNEDADNFTITDAEEISKSKIEAVLKVNGTEVKNQETDAGKYKFKLEDAGEYELTFTVKDSAGNQSKVVKTFTIAEKGEQTFSKEEVVGVVLIVLSVVVLAGVIVYFIISKRKMDKLYK